MFSNKMFHFSWKICLNQKNWIPNIILDLQRKFHNWSIFEAAKSNVAIRFYLFLCFRRRVPTYRRTVFGEVFVADHESGLQISIYGLVQKIWTK